MENIYKILKYKTVVTLSLFLFSAPALFGALSGAYTVDAGGAASATNYKNFTSLFNDLTLGTRTDGGTPNGSGVTGPVTVNVVNGVYTEQLTIAAISGVNATNTITINGNGSTIQFNPTSTTARHIIRFNGADYVAFNNFTIKTLNTTNGWGVHFMNNSDYNTIDNCVIDISAVTSSSSTNSVGVCFSSSTSSPTSTGANSKGTVISNNVIKGNPTSYGLYWGITLVPQSSYTTLSDIKIINNTIQDFYIYGIYGIYASGCLIEGNTITRPNKNVTSTCYGMIFQSGMNGTTITKNKITGLFTNPSISTYTGSLFGMYFSSTTSTADNFITNNLIYNNKMNGTYYGIYAYCVYYLKFYHNTIALDDPTATASGYSYGFNYYGCGSGNEFRNNIVSVTRGGTANKYAYYIQSGTISINNNVANVSGTNAYYGYTGGSTQSTFAEWQAVTTYGGPFDAQGVAANPNYTNYAAGDLTPRMLNADDVGVNVGVTKDFSGANRSSSSPDAGGFEFNINANATVTSFTNMSPCEETQEAPKVTIQNNSAITISGFTVSYRVNASTTVTENFVGSIAPGNSAVHTFTTPIVYTTAGNYSVEARAGRKPWLTPVVVTAMAAPKGSEVIKGATFNGAFNSGNNNDPDIVANPDEINYQLTAPTGYSNSGFGTTWIVSSLTAKTKGGANIPGTDTATFIANASNNLRLRYRPSASATDSSVIFTTVIYSLTTNCPAPPITRQVFVAPRPKAGINVTDVCDGETMQLLNASTISSGGMTYLWDLGNGTPLDDNGDQAVKYSTYGSYTVKLYVTSNYGYKDSITKVVNVYRAPEIDFSHGNQCVGTPVSFTDLSFVPNGSPQYTWEFGDNMGTSVNQNPNYTYSNTGMYMVKLTVKDAQGCVRTAMKPVTYSAKPTASFTVPTLTCNQSSISFTNTSLAAGTTGYVWSFGDGKAANESSPTHVYMAPGTYQVTVVARNEFNCADSMTKAVTLLESPVADFTLSSQCMGEPVNISNTTNEPAGTSVVYSWDFGDGSVSSSKNETHTFLGVGNYEIVLKAEANNGCKSEKRSILMFNERPVAEFSMPERACVNEVVDFKNGSMTSQSTLTYAWDLDNGSTPTVKDPSEAYTTAGVKTVKLTVFTNQGCTASITRNLTVSATPVSTFTVQSAKTGDGRMLLIPDNAGSTADYKWVYGDGGTSTEKNAHSYKFPSYGLYKITLQVSENGCKSSTSMEIVINSVSADEVAGNSINLYPNPNAGTFAIGFAGNVPANATVKIISITGQVVKEFTPGMANGQIMVDLTDVASGLYTVQVSGDNFMATRKVTVTR